MFKRCSCGCVMQLALRKVHYAHKVDISNVPVYACQTCSRNDIFPGVRADIGALIGRLGARPDRQQIRFEEHHEWAGVLSKVQNLAYPLRPDAVARMAEERTNELLDLLLIASSVGDEAWQRELRERLSQLSGQYIA